MCDNVINWCAFDWQSFATLVTGVLAVSAAFVVGKRQVAIQERQTRLQEISLRSDLFDRRYGVYEKVREFCLYILRKAEYPTLEHERDYLMAMGEAKFLFDGTVQTSLQEIWEKASAYKLLKMDMARIYKAEGHYGDGNPEREHDAIMWISGRFSDLPSLFEELKLGVDFINNKGRTYS